MVTFNCVNVALPDLDWESVRRSIERVAESYGRRVGVVNYVFVDDEEILRINREFVGHDYYTDHIGFDYSVSDRIAGDTFISLDTVRSNAVLFGKEYDNELCRVIIHSILHLCGIDDKSPDERAQMERAEDAALEMLFGHSLFYAG